MAVHQEQLRARGLRARGTPLVLRYHPRRGGGLGGEDRIDSGENYLKVCEFAAGSRRTGGA
ncbi:MAG: hypothetical protein IPG43_06210 [Proteobacteria bacterium]|nr:hypothetical protein [Pseudomonadota bacterium]